MLVNAAANELHNDKQLCIQLAREHGMLEAYAVALKAGARPHAGFKAQGPRWQTLGCRPTA